MKRRQLRLLEVAMLEHEMVEPSVMAKHYTI